jgi:hypothetical protein
MLIDGYDQHANDASHGEKLDRRINKHIRRTRVTRKNSVRPKSSNAPGGIRQRRNKRWAW